MPKVERELIAMLGEGDKVYDLVVKKGLSPAAAVSELKADLGFMEKLEKAGYSTVFPTDIHIYMAKQMGAAKELMDPGDEGRGSAAIALTAAKERVVSALSLTADYEVRARRCLSILDRDLDHYENEREATEQFNSTMTDPEKKRKLPDFPYELNKATRNNIVACIQMVQALRSDADLRAIMRVSTLNVNQGMSHDDFVDILTKDLAPVLGITESEMMTSLTKALIRRKDRKKGVVDTTAKEAGNESWRGRLPFVKAVMDSQGLGDAAAKA